MNKQELIVQIAGNTGLTQKDVKKVIEAFCDLTGTAMKNGDSVRLLGFGTFGTKKRTARIYKNLRTGEKINVPASIVPVFKAGKALKEKVKGK